MKGKTKERNTVVNKTTTPEQLKALNITTENYHETTKKSQLQQKVQHPKQNSKINKTNKNPSLKEQEKQLTSSKNSKRTMTRNTRNFWKTLENRYQSDPTGYVINSVKRHLQK